MKVAVLLACAVLTTKKITCAPLDALDNISESDKKYLDFLHSYFYSPKDLRPKRSSSDDAFQSIKASIGQGIKSKLGLIAKGSSHYSGSGGHSYHHDYHPEYDTKSFDFWTLKKSILNTLLQAVKAIKGGVIAIKGQLIKGSGYLISAKGKLIASKGDAITNLGKNIAASAILSPADGHSQGHSHSHHHDEYASPSAPGPDFHPAPEHYHHHDHHYHGDQPDADHAGILILKKIPTHDDHDHKTPDFKPIADKGPSWGEIIGKFFSASTSLKPGYPEPFGDEYDHHYHHEHDHEHEHHHSSHEDYHDDIHTHSSHSESHHYHESPSPSSDHNIKESTPFEEAPDFLNIAEYTSESKDVPKTESHSKPEPEPIKPTPETQTPIKYDEIRPLPSAYSNINFDTSLLENYEKPKLLIGSFSNKPNVDFPPLSPQSSALTDTNLQFGAFPANFDSSLKYLAPNSNLGPQVFPNQDTLSAFTSLNPQTLKYQSSFPNFQSYRPSFKRPTRSKNHSHSRRKRPIYPYSKFIKSHLHHLGPDGPKRL